MFKQYNKWRFPSSGVLGGSFTNMNIRAHPQERRFSGSAPNTRSSSPVHVHRGVPAREEFTRVPSDSEDHQRRRRSLVREILHDVTFDCMLFVCMTLLMLLAMTSMTVVVILHALSGGRLFNRQVSRKNITADDRPPYNFYPWTLTFWILDYFFVSNK